MIFGNKNGNKILIHKKDGQVCEVSHIRGLNVRFKGKNSTIEIWEPFCFRRRFGELRCKIRVAGDDNYIKIDTGLDVLSLQIIHIKDNNKITIGKNFFSSGLVKVDFAAESNLEFSIGNDCMFGQNIKFMLGDNHRIYDINTNEQLNASKRGIKIGNHVWLARNVVMLKDTSIADNSVVAYGSLVTKNFLKENILIGGYPAKELKENINWEK